MKREQPRSRGRMSHPTLVIGVVFAKKRLVARAANARGVELAQPLTLGHRKRGFEALLRWIQELQQAHGLSAAIVGMEPTGHAWMALAQFLRRQAVLVVLVHPARVNENRASDDTSPAENGYPDTGVMDPVLHDGRYAIPLLPTGAAAELQVSENGMERKDVRRDEGRSRSLALQDTVRQSAKLTGGRSRLREVSSFCSHAMNCERLNAVSCERTCSPGCKAPDDEQRLTVPGVGPVSVAGFWAVDGDLMQSMHGCIHWEGTT